jgi:hypothetical protein
MTAGKGKTRHKGDTYFDRTHRPLLWLLFILPPLGFYHVCTLATGSLRRSGANVHLLELLGWFGAGPALLAPLLILTVLLGMHLSRRDPWRLEPATLAGMAAESALWTLPILAVNLLRGQFVSASAQAGSGDYVVGQVRPGLKYLCADVGAAVYEEFVFRLVLISLILLLFVDIFELKEQAVLVGAVLLSALLFSLYHRISGTQPPLSSMILWGAQGVLWGTLLWFRGFGICVGSHVCVNLLGHGLYALGSQSV